jgi:hypothetical protein
LNIFKINYNTIRDVEMWMIYLAAVDAIAEHPWPIAMPT